MKYKIQKHLLLISILTLAVIAGAVFYILNKNKNVSDPKYHVVLRGDGFHPKELVIQKGSTVVFSAEHDMFWPASSPHPEHTDYAEFDPKRALNPQERWEFTFQKLGTWLYHDHVKHGNVGRIVVVDKVDTNQLVSLARTNCLDVPREQKLGCWDSQLENVLASAGIDAAFEAFKQIYNTEPDVPKACHEWGHILGEAAYDLYRIGHKIHYRDEMSFCGYSFFHGFLEKLTAYTGDITLAREWCESLIQNEPNNEGARRNCIHGVGHGATAWLMETKENWGNFEKVSKIGLELCDKAFAGKDLSECYDGVFNELHMDVFNSQYGLSLEEYKSKNDPFWYCRNQQDRHKESCYFEFVGIFYSLFDFDLDAAMNFVVNNVDDLPTRGPRVVAKLAADFIQFDIVKSDQKRNVRVCRSIPEYLFSPCFYGIVNGFIQHGEPENMHVRGIAFCTADYLTKTENRMCLSSLFGALEHHYSFDQMRNACAQLTSANQTSYCSKYENAT